MADNRKINFFEIKVNNGFDSRSCIENIMNQIRIFNAAKAPQRQKPTANGNTLQVIEIHPSKHYYNCKAKLIRDEFPEIANRRLDTEEVMDAENDPDKGIHEETHFVISLNSQYLNPIIGIESCMRAAKHNDIEKYLESMLIHSGAECDLVFEPLFAFSYDEFLNRISDVASIKMMFYRNDIEAYSQYDEQTGQLLRNAMSYGEPEYLILEFGINFQKKKNRVSTVGLMQSVRHLVGVLMGNPEAKNYIKKLDIRAEDNNYNQRLRLFDLIESKVASEVPADRKRPRSQYYDSQTLYESIRTQIEKDFGE